MYNFNYYYIIIQFFISKCIIIFDICRLYFNDYNIFQLIDFLFLNNQKYFLSRENS